MKKRVPSVREELTPHDILSVVEDLASEVRTSLSLAEVAALVSDRYGSVSDIGLLAHALLRSPKFASAPNDLFTTREALFRGAVFRVEPDPEEIKRGILIPGHRFLPLWGARETEEVKAVSGDGGRIPRKSLKLRFSEAFPYHCLLGYNWLPDFTRGSSSQDRNASSRFKVFDLGSFYRETRFRPGDFLLVEIRDPRAREVAFHYESRSAALKKVALIRACDVEIEKAFLRIIEEPNVLWSLSEQLFQALARVPPKVLKYPGSTFQRFLTKTSSFTLQEVGLEIAAFPRNTSPFELAVRRTAEEAARPDVFADPLDQLLTRLGINLHSASLKGLLRLAASEGDSFTDTMSGIIPWKRLRRSGGKDVRRLRDHLKRMWRDAVREEAENPIPPEMASLYRRAASLKQRVLEILRELDLLGLRAEELPSRPLLRMVEIDELAECILQLDAGAEPGFGKAAELEELVAEVENHLVRLQGEILSETFVT